MYQGDWFCIHTNGFVLPLQAPGDAVSRGGEGEGPHQGVRVGHLHWVLVGVWMGVLKVV